ncbi:hypothetical protein [Croceicoccus sp. Ery15]|uniref:hypothetical protein n=1 Tax=Croceicoccus sp. Ery15 TaxID=1703338 RepID=UPI001E4786E0|nr:hypothetical protein [Croceicoccus sp. Ery15]
MEGFVHEQDFGKEVEAAASDPLVPSAISHVQSCPTAHDDTIRTYRGLLFGLPVAVGLWAAIIGVSAYLIA